jgi:hypothetical protein
MRSHLASVPELLEDDVRRSRLKLGRQVASGARAALQKRRYHLIAYLSLAATPAKQQCHAILADGRRYARLAAAGVAEQAEQALTVSVIGRRIDEGATESRQRLRAVVVALEP